MYSSGVTTHHQTDTDAVDNERVLSLYGVILASIGALGVLFFWTMGAIGLLTNDGGLILDLRLTGVWRTLYFALPVVVLVCVAGAIGLFALRRHKEAVGLAGLPVIATIAYYFALVQLR
jgi:hypothetical protein